MLHDVSFGQAPDQPRIRPTREVASVAVLSDGCLLLGIRHDTGKLTLPGGGIEPGEAPEEAACRELWEEAGLKATGRLEYLGCEATPGYKDPTEVVLVHAFRVFLTGEPTPRHDPDHEVKRWLWVPVDSGRLAPEFASELYVSRNVTLKLLGLLDFPTPEIDQHVIKRPPTPAVVKLTLQAIQRSLPTQRARLSGGRGTPPASTRPAGTRASPLRKADAPLPVVPPVTMPVLTGAPDPDAWLVRVVTDVGRPMCKPFRVGERVYARRGGYYPGITEPVYHLLRARADPASGQWTRRRVTETQLEGATRALERVTLDRVQKARLSLGWARLEPKHAGFWPGTDAPRRYMGIDFYLADVNPEVDGDGWQGDTIKHRPSPPDMRGIIERRVAEGSPRDPGPGRRRKIIMDIVIHEREELRLKERIVDEEHPFISDEDRSRCMDEVEGLAHALTIQQVEGFAGPRGERDYLRRNDEATLRELGMDREADSAEATDAK